ncbi:MAG: HlyD family efflux transporter periplasmic adaptor subunit [Kofleriaceae bacterium]
MRYGSAADAPTHLGSKDLGLPPEWLPEEAGEIVTSAKRELAARALLQAPPTHLSFAHREAQRVRQPAPVAARPPTERSHPVSPRVSTERSEAPDEVPSVHVSREDRSRMEKAASRVVGTPSRGSSVVVAPPVREPAPLPVAVALPRREDKSAERRARSSAGGDAKLEERSSSKDKSRSSSKSRSKGTPAPAPTPQAPAQQARAGSQPQIPQMPPGINAIDPLAVAVPPELGATIYGWVRRLALQADLAAADRVLRDALLDLTSSLAVTIVYPGQDGLWSLGADEEIPRDAQPLIAVAMARKAIVSSHSAVIPIVTTSETVAVITLTRNPRNPAFHPIEQIAMIALARESASIMHHLAVAHIQHAKEINADKGGLYRGEALEAHRSRGNEGVPVNLTPGWVKRTYPVLCISLLIAVVVSIFITVPTYSSGQGMVVLQGTTVTSPAPGTVDQILVKQGDSVKKGQILIRMHAANEEAELAQATTEYNNIQIQYLFDQTDEQMKKSLAGAYARVERLQAAVDTRVVRARKDGVVSDRRIQLGQALQAGDHILTIVDPGTEPEVVAFLPGTDRPRLRVGQTLQVQLGGYKKIRELATITSIGNEIVGGNEAARFLGAQQQDTFKLQGGSFVIVKARLPSRTFQTEHRTYYYFHGMQAVTEVKIQSKPFLVTLLPAIEKYLPE